MKHAAEHFKLANQAGMEALATMADTAFGGLERITALNLSTARSMLEQREAGSRRLLAARDAQTVLTLHAGAILESTKQAMSYSQRTFEISAQTGNELSRVLGRGVASAL